MGGFDLTDDLAGQVMFLADFRNGFYFLRALDDHAESGSHIKHFIHLGVADFAPSLDQAEHGGDGRKGISDNDFICAAKIDRLVAETV